MEREMVLLRNITIDVSEEVKRILPRAFTKQLMQDEQLCPVCGGLGIAFTHNLFGIKVDRVDAAKRLNFPYNHPGITSCPNCYGGVIKVCEHCGKPFEKGKFECSCQKEKWEKRREKYQEIIAQSREVSLEEASGFFFDAEYVSYFSSIEEFVEYWWDCFLNNADGDTFFFDEYFEKYVPKILWNCTEENINRVLRTKVVNVADDMQADGSKVASGEMDFWDFIEKWSDKKPDVRQRYLDCEEYVRVQKSWFDEKKKTLMQ